MKKTIVRLALLCGIASASNGAFAQYYVPPAARPTATYRSPGAPATAAPQVSQRSMTTPAAYPAARPMPVPAMVAQSRAPSSVPSFRPINPPPARQQGPRAIVANRNVPTPAPAPSQIRSASKSQIGPAPSQVPAQMYSPSMSGMGWNAPSTTMPMDSGAGAFSQGAYGQGANGFQGQMTGGPAPVTDPGMNYAGGDGGYVGEGGGYGADCGGECGGCGHHCGCCARLGMLVRCCTVPFCTTGDMGQHMPFFGTTHGYYYFRPYHVMHVFSQQELATRWGGDPRNPYDNTMFHRIYEQMGVEAKTKAPPGTAPMQPGGEYLGPGQTITPTPVPMYESPSQSYVPSPSSVLPVAPLPGVESIAPPTR